MSCTFYYRYFYIMQRGFYLESVYELYFLGQQELVLQLGVDQTQGVGHRLLCDI